MFHVSVTHAVFSRAPFRLSRGRRESVPGLTSEALATWSTARGVWDEEMLNAIRIDRPKTSDPRPEPVPRLRRDVGRLGRHY